MKWTNCIGAADGVYPVKCIQDGNDDEDDELELLRKDGYDQELIGLRE